MKRIALVTLVLMTGCAAATRNVERTYSREDLADVPLRTIDLVVFVSGPPRVADQVLDVKTFDPPGRDEPLFVGAEDVATREALASELTAQLGAAGFRVRVIRASSAIAPLGPTNTSTHVATTLTATVVAPGDRARIGGSATQVALDTKTTLRALESASTADAILVVRAVPVDTFFIDFGSGTKLERTGLDERPERVQDVKPVKHEGRLMLGQAFLFDRKTGLRLWTRQVPDFPDGGRLTPNHPFLAYGFVVDPKTTAPGPDARAKAAAQNFATKMLGGFPKATEGLATKREELDAIDVDRALEIESFFDRGHLTLELGARYSVANAQLDMELAGAKLDPLETGAIAPAGAFALAPRAAYITPGGLLIAVELDVGIAPGDFSRTYFRENPNPTTGDPDDRAATVKIAGVKTYGADATLGIAMPLSERVFLVPSGGIFAELWSIDATPATVIGDSDKTRLGLTGGIDLWLRSDADGGLYGRFGGGLKAGIDTSGPVIFGGQIAASLGVFL